MQSNDHETAKVTKRAKPKSNNWFMRFLRSIGQGFKNIGLFFVNTGKAIGRFFSSIYNHFIRGAWAARAIRPNSPDNFSSAATALLLGPHPFAS